MKSLILAAGKLKWCIPPVKGRREAPSWQRHISLWRLGRMAVNEIYGKKDKEKWIWNLSKCRCMDKTQATAFLISVSSGSPAMLPPYAQILRPLFGCFAIRRRFFFDRWESFNINAWLLSVIRDILKKIRSVKVKDTHAFTKYMEDKTANGGKKDNEWVRENGNTDYCGFIWLFYAYWRYRRSDGGGA